MVIQKIRSRRLLIFCCKICIPDNQSFFCLFAKTLSVQRLKNLYIVPDNRSFFCLFAKTTSVQ